MSRLLAAQKHDQVTHRNICVSQAIGLSIRVLFGSAGAINAGSTITVEGSHMDGPEGSATIGPAFSGSKTFAVGDGSYTVTTSVVQV